MDPRDLYIAPKRSDVNAWSIDVRPTTESVKSEKKRSRIRPNVPKDVLELEDLQNYEVDAP